MTDGKSRRIGSAEPDDRRHELRRTVRTLLVFALLAVPLVQSGAWEYSEFSFDVETRAALMASAGPWNPYFEAKGTFHGADAEFRYHSLLTGSYFRAAPWLKVGAFYRLEGGARHVEDWTVIDVIGPDDIQYWEDVSGRYGHSLLLDATPRFLLPRLPGRNWLAAVKIRYAYDMTAGHHSVLFRPGITYALMPDRDPTFSFTLSYPVYLALNFNDFPLYGHGPYFGVLWHAREDLKVEGQFAFLMKRYEKTAFGGPWILHSRHLTAGLGLIYTPDFR